MIQEINFQNFKAFNSLKELQLKPITIFCGSNSCGKSTILQSILFLKQTLESKNTKQTILLNGRLVHLGSFENMIYQREVKNEVEFNFKFKVNKFKSRSFRYLTHEWGDIANKNIEHILIDYKVSLKSTKSTNNSIAFLKQVKITKLEFAVEYMLKNGEKLIGPSFIISSFDEEVYTIYWNNVKDSLNLSINLGSENYENGEVKVKISFSNLCPSSFEFLDEQDAQNIGKILILRPFFGISEILRSLFETVTYIGPLREEPSRRYIYEDEIVEMGNKGENAAYIFLSEQDNYLYEHYFMKDDTFVEISPVRLLDAVDLWLNYMGIRGLKPESNNEVLHINLQSSSSDKTKVSIADVGFGVSQVLPIILEGLRMNEESTLLLEQPEIHLHPKLQMQMADYFIALAMSNKNVVVETHSDHMVNRLVRRIIEDETGKLNDLVGIYFVTPSKEGSSYETVRIDDTKGIVNWPEGFFDQNATEQERIIRAGIKRRKSQRSKGKTD